MSTEWAKQSVRSTLSKLWMHYAVFCCVLFMNLMMYFAACCAFCAHQSVHGKFVPNGLCFSLCLPQHRWLRRCTHTIAQTPLFGNYKIFLTRPHTRNVCVSHSKWTILSHSSPHACSHDVQIVCRSRYILVQ